MPRRRIARRAVSGVDQALSVFPYSWDPDYPARIGLLPRDGGSEGPSTLTRFTIDLLAGKVHEQQFDQQSQEFPRIDQRLTGSRHRYGYSVGVAAAHGGDGVIKHDLVAGTSTVRRLGAGHEAGEFCFVPLSGASAEGDGVLMGYVLDRVSDRSDLVLLDAQTLDDVARVRLPGRVPAGFHGNWASSAVDG